MVRVRYSYLIVEVHDASRKRKVDTISESDKKKKKKRKLDQIGFDVVNDNIDLKGAADKNNRKGKSHEYKRKCMDGVTETQISKALKNRTRELYGDVGAFAIIPSLQVLTSHSRGGLLIVKVLRNVSKDMVDIVEGLPEFDQGNLSTKCICKVVHTSSSANLCSRALMRFHSIDKQTDRFRQIPRVEMERIAKSIF